MLLVGNSQCRNVTDDSFPDIFCSEKRLEQIQEWMPEYCASLRDVYNGGSEGMKECYGDFAAFRFEQTYVVDETGADCSLRSVGSYCNMATINSTFCATKCSYVLQHLSELYGCCLPTLAWLGIPTQYNYELIQLQNDICNVSTGFCAPVFSQTILGLPPEQMVPPHLLVVQGLHWQ